MAEPSARAIAARTHGRYLVAAPAGPGPHPLLLGFHGYGENAERCLAELRRIPGAERWLVAAVQGLHRFYNQKTGEVVASWMTKQDRELAIADNVAYVGAVAGELRREFDLAPTVALLGFSQGVAMAYRAALGSVERAAAVIALAGDVPPELHHLDLTRLGRVLVARGATDESYTADKMAADAVLLRGKGLACEELTYSGGHEWTDEFRRAVGEFLERRGP